MQDNTGLLVLPLPILTALLGAGIAVLVLRLDWGSRKASIFFALLFMLLSASSLLVGLRFGYGMQHLILLQRILPLLVGPLIFLGFAAFAIPKERFNRHAIRHVGIALLIMGFLLAVPRPLYALDWVISGSYLVYIILLVRLWRRGPDHLIHAHFDVTQKVSNWMLRGVFLMTSILVIDTVIAFDFALNGGRNAKALISFASVPIMGALLSLIFLLPSMIAAPRGKATIPMPAESDDRQKLEQKARALLLSTRLYLEPDLSVQRLARRLHVPVRDLSVAVNQTQGMNVSQYVNQFRMEHAADLLRGTDESVAKVMAQSGFLTRSNFYREFQRVFGMTPAAYRQAQMQKGET